MDLRPIGEADIGPVADFLHRNLNDRVTAAAWASGMRPPWMLDVPNHGVLLEVDSQIVGAYLAIYSERELRGTMERFCNLAAWCVLEDYRAHSFRMIRALLKQPDCTFTDFSPSGAVVDLNLRLGFEPIENPTALLPGLGLSRSILGGGAPRARIVSEPEELGDVLTGEAHRVNRDHAATPIRQLAVVEGERACLVLYRRERLKRIPRFATIIHVSDSQLFLEHSARIARHLLVRSGILAAMVELRLLGNQRPNGSVMIDPPRQRMYRSDRLTAEDIDYLYSELAAVAW